MRGSRCFQARRCRPVLALSLLCLASQARARGHSSPAQGAGRSRKVDDAPASPRRGALPQAPPHDAQIAITIAGDPDCGQALHVLLAEQLADITSEVSWSCQPSFDADEPFRRAPRARVDARVWVDLSAADEARLTLQNGLENRFFLRRLPLARGLDEIGREEIAEVVRSATMAVLTGGAGALTRAEAQATVARWPAPVPREASPPPAPPPVREDLVVAERAREIPPRPGPVLQLGPTWTLQTLARGLPTAQELALSVSLSGPSGRLSVWLESGYRLPATYSGESIGVRVTALAARVGIAFWTSGDRPFRLGFGGGVGVKRIGFSPEGDASTIDPAAPAHFNVIAGRARVAFRIQPNPRIVLGLDLLCDIATADVHFDLRDANGTVQRVLTQWPVQPGVSLLAAWRWGG